MKTISSFEELKLELQKNEKAYLLLYKSGSEQSNCAYKNMSELEIGAEICVMAADVNIARDIHTAYGITTVPTLLIFESGELINTIKGCQDKDFLKGIFNNAIYQAKMKTEGKAPKRVTVYSTPTCTWCNTLKSWLRKQGIPFTDIDVSRDVRAAQELMQRTGQQGVPQTEINGQWVIGFDQKRLKELLEI
ncbi:MAG: thioredoxin family protein [Bacteroidales bacterium]|nr:thioredoxin family protein [Bacteroidales bacterium]